MKSVLFDILNWGHAFTESLGEKKRVKLLNTLVLTGLPFLIFSALLNLIKEDYEGAAFSAIGFLLLTFTLLLNKQGWIYLAKWFFFIILLSFIILAYISFGKENTSTPILLVLILASFVFFSKRNHLITVNVLIFLVYFAASYYIQHYPPIFPVDGNNNTWTTFLGCMVLQLLIAIAFVNENQSYEKHTKQLVNQLRESNENLSIQKQELHENNKDLIQAKKELERIAYATSHDLKTPIRNIVSFSDLLKSGTNQSESEEYLGFIKRNALRLNSLISNMLMHATLDNAFNKEPLSINHILKEIHAEIAESSFNDFQMNYSDFPRILANKMHFKLVLKNLIENGLLYNKQMIPSVFLSCEVDDSLFNIYIKDNGIGIQRIYWDSIFELFNRLHAPGNYEGAGIGLSMAKKIVSKYKGNIKVAHSEADHGSTFLISLPVEIIV